MHPVYQKIKQELKEYYSDSEATALARMLLMEKFCFSKLELFGGKDKQVFKKDLDVLDEMLSRLKIYEPIQYILGKEIFCGLEFEVDKNGKVQQKLFVLPFLHELLYHNCMIGNFINSGIYIRADYFVGNTRTILSVGFRYGKKFDFPVTLYREDVRKLTHPTNKVLAIFAKKCKEEKYSECTYLSKGQKIEKLINTDKIDLEKIGNIK